MVKKLSIVIPAYNEENRIERTLRAYISYFKANYKDFEVIVVLNACVDNTSKIVSKMAKKEKKLRVLEFERGGKGFAVIEGFRDALKRKNDIIGFVDADMATTPEAFEKLVLEIDGFEGAIASRYVKGSIVKPKQSVQRRIVSRGFNFIVRVVLGLKFKDTQCGAKVFKRNAVEIFLDKLSLSRWAFDVDILYQMKTNKMKVKEVPTIWRDVEDSKLNFLRVSPMMFLGIVRLRLLNSKLRFLIKFYDKITKVFGRLIDG